MRKPDWGRIAFILSLGAASIWLIITISKSPIALLIP